jgi:hypothetical protein
MCEFHLCTTQTRDAITRTLLFHNYYSCAGTVIGSCFHNGTTYSVCCHSNQHTCFDPVYAPSEQWLEVQHTTGSLITQTQIINPHQTVSVYFNACVTTSHNSDADVSECTTLSWVRSYTIENKYTCEEQPNGYKYRCYGDPCALFGDV